MTADRWISGAVCLTNGIASLEQAFEVAGVSAAMAPKTGGGR